MTLRLVLVTMVAALGVTIPSGPVWEHWFSSTRTWSSCSWTARNGWTAGRGPTSIVAEESRPCELCRLARARLALREHKAATPSLVGMVKQEVAKPANATKASAAHENAATVVQHNDEIPGGGSPMRAPTAVPAIAAAQKPITVPAGVVARDLVRTPELLLDLPADVFTPAAVAFRPTPVSAASHERVAPMQTGQAETTSGQRSVVTVAQVAPPVSISEDLDLWLFAELSRSVPETATVDHPTAVADCEDPGASVPDGTFLCGDGFGPDDVTDVESPLAGPEHAPARDGNQAAAPSTGAAFEIEDDAAYEFEESADEASAIASVQTASELPWPAFVPLEQFGRADTNLGISNPQPAAATSRAVSSPDAGQSVSSARQTSASSTCGGAPRESGLGQAVQLTRNAVAAWVRVLSGPALVNVTAR